MAVYVDSGDIVRKLAAITQLLTKQGSKLMALSDDVAALTTAVATLQSTVTMVASQMDTLLADLNAALANSGVAQDPAVQAAVSKLATLNSTLQAAATRDAPPTGP